MSESRHHAAALSREERARLESRLLWNKHGSSDARIPRRAAPGPCPLSFAQERLWFLDQLEPDTATYNVSAGFRLTGSLDLAALKRSLSEIVRRHEALRTTFRSLDGSPVQVIGPPQPVALPEVDLSHLPEPEREIRAEQLATEEARRPFDLSAGPLLRTTLFRLSRETHILLLIVHHVVFDGWSLSVLLRELVSLYQAFSAGDPCTLPELPIQYADFAVWQRNWLQEAVLDSQLSYWRRKLSGHLPAIHLPSDRPRPPIRTSRGSHDSLKLPPDLMERLNAFSRRERVTLFMTLLAAFQILLYRYTGQEDIVVASPIAGRNQVEIESLIGFFTNTLVLRTDLSGEPTFLEVLGRVRDVALEAYTYQDLPFEKLVEELQPQRSLSHSPLFQVMFVLQNAPKGASRLGGLTISPVRVSTDTAKFDLTLGAEEMPDGLRTSIEYATDLFDAATVRRMLEHFHVLLKGIVANPDERISKLPLLTDSERAQLMTDWNDTAAEYPQDRCIHELFEAQAERTPDAVALVSEDRVLPYGELNMRANRLAHHLIGLGVGPDSVVGIALERSLEMVVALLATLKAGGAYLPLDPDYPAARLAFMVEDAEPACILTTTEIAPRLPDSPQRFLINGREAVGALARCPTTNPGNTERREALTPEHPAYVIYTSGSTGTPKGVVVPHRALANKVCTLNEYLEVSRATRFAAITSISFDPLLDQIFCPLCAGGTSVIVPDGIRDDVKRFSAYAERCGISILNATPGLIERLLYKGALGVRLQALLIGGDVLPPSLANKLLADGVAQRILNVYGPTEACINASAYEIAEMQLSGSVPIGSPLPNYRLYVLDRHLELVPVRVPGELYIAGAGLALGYLKRPGLTAERFVADPYGEPGTRMYRTGDLVKWRADGVLEFLGRADRQVKIRGFRVEPGEVEMVLRGLPGVAEAAVVAREDQPGEKRLVGYVVAEPGAVAETAALRRKLGERLPDYMVPGTFVMLDELPLTPSGKLDWKALPAPEPANEGYRAPRDTLEARLTTIWEDALGVRPIGITDNFFDLGGHSLKAVLLFDRIDKMLGKNLPMATLFEAQTIERLAAVIRDQGWRPSWAPLVPIQPGGSEPPLFCVHGLAGNVLFYQDLARHLAPDQPVYGIQALGLDGKTDPPATVEELAGHYVREIRGLQPDGPYRLGGYCFGAYVALEMARQLEEQGQKVALLACFDTDGGWRIARSVWGRMQYHMENLSRLGPGRKVSYLTNRLQYRLSRVGRTTFDLLARLCLRFGRTQPPALRRIHMWEVHLNASRAYRPKPVNAKLTYFQCGSDIHRDPRPFWSPLVKGGLQVHQVPGRDMDVLKEPHVIVLAERLRRCLEETRRTDLQS